MFKACLNCEQLSIALRVVMAIAIAEEEDSNSLKATEVPQENISPVTENSPVLQIQ